MPKNQNNTKPVRDGQPRDEGLSSSVLFASDIDDETYVIRDKSGKQKMLMTRTPGSKWKLYALLESDQYRSDLMERHGISHANAKALAQPGHNQPPTP